MGISSNQARLMTLTARQHDLELRAQQISAEKMIKGLESQEAAMNYSKCLNLYSSLLDREARFGANTERIPVIVSDCGDGKFSFNTINPNDIEDDGIKDECMISIDGKRYYKSSDGRIIPYYTDFLCDGDNMEVFNLMPYSITPSGFASMNDDDWTTEQFIEEVKAQYQELTTSLSTQEKLLDMELTQINTEHSAVKTEYDSVKGLVGENVDKSFNVFS